MIARRKAMALLVGALAVRSKPAAAQQRAYVLRAEAGHHVINISVAPQ